MYKTSTLQAVLDMPVGLHPRRKAMAAARRELTEAGCEERQGCGDDPAGWGRVWYTADGIRLSRRPNMNAIEVLLFYRKFIKGEGL